VRLSGVIPASVRDFGFSNSPLARVQMIAAIVPWLIFSIYWEAAAKNAAAAASSESKLSRGIHVTLTNLAVLLEVVQLPVLGRFLPVSSAAIAAGLAVSGIGLFIAIWSRRHLGRNWSGEISIKVEHQLIRSGPYRRLRHPIYTGILTIYAGTAIVTGTWLAILGLAIAAFAYARKIRLEEANLRVAFGPDYDAYCHETWALVPWIY
jgi:protein-S-isoprenylcysteine O-methyltransferase Ste14